MHRFQELWHLDLAALWHVDLPRPGIDPVSPALAGGFLTIGPPGKPSACHLMKNQGNVGICP